MAVLGPVSPLLEMAEAQHPRKANKRTSTATRSTQKAKKPTPQPITTPAPITLETLPSAVAGTLQGYKNVGLVVAPASDGTPILSLSSNRPFIPASNRKVFTGALALDQLGSEYRFLTTLHRTGPISGGVVQGDLVITPSGDPTMNSELFRGQSGDWVYQNWALRLRSIGIHRIRGSLVVDVSAWDMRDLAPRGWAPRILDDHYAPKPSPLTVNSNLINVRAIPGDDGASPRVEFVPPAAGYPVIVTATTGDGKGFQISRGTGGRISVSGTGNRIAERRLPVDNPTLYAAAVLRHRMKDAGISIDGGVRLAARSNEVPAATRETVLAAYQSPPMNEMVRHMMKHSDNHFAEQLFLTVSHARDLKGSYSRSQRIEQEFLRRIGMPMAGFRGEDGSGLSELNTVTAEGTVHLLRTMLSHPASRDFVESMPISGRDGTLQSRMRDGAAAERVRAKTGFISGVSCLSGYLTLPSKREPVAFSMLFNRLGGGPGGAKSAQDRICEMIVRAHQ